MIRLTATTVLLAAILGFTSARCPAQAGFTPSEQEEVLLLLEDRAVKVVRSLLTGRQSFAREEMTPVLSRGLTPEALGVMFGELHVRGGRFRDVGEVTFTHVAGERVTARIPLLYERNRFAAEVEFERLGPLAKVSGFRIVPPGEERDDARAATTYPLPPYVDMLALRELDLVVRAGGEDLPAVLTLPMTASTSRPVAAALIMPGDFGWDIDGTVGGGKVARDWALGLAGRGVATLRYAGRGHVAPGSFEPPLRYDINAAWLNDASAAFRLLAERPEVDAARAGIVGVGMAGFLVAGMSEELAVARVVMANPPGDPPLDSLARSLDEAATTAPPNDRPGLQGRARDYLRAAGGILAGDAWVDGRPAVYWESVRRRDGASALVRSGTAALLLFPADDSESATADRASWMRVLSTSINSSMEIYNLEGPYLEQAGPGGARWVGEQPVTDAAAFFLTGRLPI